MASATRLERLRKLTLADVDALPDRPLEPIVSDSDASGGVSLEPALGQPSKQTTAKTVAPHTEPVAEEQVTDRRFVWLKDVASSYNPAPMPQSSIAATPPPSAALPAINLQRGDLAQAQHHFAPIQAVAKYPYRFCDKAHQQDIASAFFDQGQFWAREWDLYYVWDIGSLSKPLVLVRETQLQDLLNEINKHLRLTLRITNHQREEALVSRFPDHPRCTPRYLGRSRSREDYDSMIENAPHHSFRAAGEPESVPLDESRLEAFKQLMEDSFDAQKAKNKATRAKKKQERLVKQKTMADQFKRAQRYLGLRPNAVTGAPTLSGPPAAVDTSLPAPFDFDQSVVFVCVDVESYERAHNKITEVGVATLDTRELLRVPPGQDGRNWRDLIHARHFRIKEHAHLVNHEFVSGHPDGFDFGTSTVVPLAEAPTHVATCFAPPFGAHPSNGVDSMVEFMKHTDQHEKRNIIFLGHDTLGDVRYLQNLGFDPMKVENLLEALDTAVMYRVWRREQNPTSLGRILYDFDIPGYKLHNAGNDAVFTVQAMLGICVREASIRGSSELDSMRDSEKAARLAEAVEEAQKKANDEAEGWSDHDPEGDGGAPVSIAISPPKPTPANIMPHIPSDRSRGASRGRGRGRGGPQGSLCKPSDNPNSFENSSGRGVARSNHGQTAGIRIPTEGRRDGRSDKHSRGEGSSRGRGRGRGSLETPPQTRYYW